MLCHVSSGYVGLDQVRTCQIMLTQVRSSYVILTC